MTPDGLLLETQRALSFDQLYAPHTKLIELQDSVRAVFYAVSIMPSLFYCVLVCALVLLLC